MSNTCQNCKCFNAGDGVAGTDGTCRQAPPTVLLPAVGNPVSHFPSVSNEGWCEAFKAVKSTTPTV